MYITPDLSQNQPRNPVENSPAPAAPQPATATSQLTRPAKPSKSGKKTWLVLLIIGIVGFVLGVGCFIFVLVRPKETKASLVFPQIPTAATTKTYSALTGVELADASLVNAPTYCVQTPNGTDGARPQAGLTQAGVVFEAIAEAGITRFAAIYQNANSAVIGPIRSLRLYYLQWDTPFNCTIVHAGGSDEAIAAVRDGGYRDLTENYTYMYRGSYGSRLWNNLFTTGSYLAQVGVDTGNTTSNVNGFTRNTPEIAAKNRADSQAVSKLEITTPSTANTSEMAPAKVAEINLYFGGVPSFNPVYKYNASNNTYDRFYGSGVAHEVYECPAENLGEKNPEDVCSLTQLSPSVVIAMMVEEGKASDNYHEKITTVGKNTAYIFQNGTAVKGTWEKTAVDAQIKFYDENGAEVALNPGQTWISAIPTYGGVEY